LYEFGVERKIVNEKGKSIDYVLKVNTSRPLRD
jgi:hypothetical protein